MTRQTRLASISALGAVLFPALLIGALLGDAPDFPQLAFDSGGTTSFNATTRALAIQASPVAIRLSPADTPRIVNPSGSTESVSVSVRIGASGELIGGAPGDDLSVIGEVDLGALGFFSGVLLTGEATAFGFQDSGGPTDFFDFRFTPTGGQLLFLYQSGDIVVNVQSEGSTFSGDFSESDFAGGAKGTLGSKPRAACVLVVDKTCCIPPPPRPPLEYDCTKPIDVLTMIYNGAGTVDVIAHKGGTGSAVVGTVIGITHGSEVSVSGFAGSPNDVVWEIFDTDTGAKLGESEFHLSCSDPEMNGPEDCGRSQGNGKDNRSGLDVWILEGIVDGAGALECTVPDPVPQATSCVLPSSTGDDCQGDVLEAVFEYLGGDCSQSSNLQDKPDERCQGGDPGFGPVSIAATGKGSDKLIVTPSTMISVGADSRVSFTHSDGKLRSDTRFDIVGAEGTQSLKIHTSCSKPLNVGDVFGALRLVKLRSTEGGTVVLPDPSAPLFTNACSVPAAPPAPHCTTKVSALTLRYLGGDCSQSANLQDKPDLRCLGMDPGAGPVSIEFTKDADKLAATPGTSIGTNDLVTLTHQDGKLASETKFDVVGSAATQSLMIHTSCSKPLNLGDRFGAFEVFAIDRQGNGMVSLGASVEYQYTITNPSLTSSLLVTSVLDDKLSELLAPETLTLAPEESTTLFQTTTLFGTTKNSVFVTGEQNGAQCEATDMVTVTVERPPPPPPAPYVCKKPIDALTMIYNGVPTIDVVAHKGNVGAEIVGTVAGVTTGTEVTITGFSGSPNDVFWELFDSVSGTKLGESSFHLSCSDSAMNGPEDCGLPQGNGKDNASGLNVWLLKGIVDAGGQLVCPTP